MCSHDVLYKQDIKRSDQVKIFTLWLRQRHNFMASFIAALFEINIAECQILMPYYWMKETRMNSTHSSAVIWVAILLVFALQVGTCFIYIQVLGSIMIQCSRFFAVSDNIEASWAINSAAKQWWNERMENKMVDDPVL